MTEFQNPLSTPSTWPGLRLHWRSLVLCFVISFGIAGIGNALTELGPWYYQLKQPPWKPPDAAFGAIWTTIFSLCSVSAWLAWNAAPTSGRRGKVLFLFLFNGALNICWSVLYFQLHRPDWSLWELLALWLSVLWLVLGLWRESRLASFLVLPYLIWVSIAGVLNYSTVILNGPFVQALQQLIPVST
jgi:tryptophan-rich sensory protein